MIQNIKTQWDIEKLYPIGEGQEKLIREKVEHEVKEFTEKWKGRIKSLDKSDIRDFITEYSGVMTGLTPLYYRYMYLSDLDTQDTVIRKKFSDITRFWGDTGKNLLFINEEFKELGHTKLLELSREPGLSDISLELEKMSRGLKYIRSSEVESVMCDVSHVTGIFTDIYDELIGAIEYNFRGQSLTYDELVSKLESPDREVRRDAFNARKAVFRDRKNLITFGGLYKGVLMGMGLNREVYGTEGGYVERIENENLDLAVVDNLLNSIFMSYGIYQDYLKIKAKYLGLDKLSLFDISAPVGKCVKEYDVDTGISLFFELMEGMGAQPLSYAKKMFVEGRIDLHPRKGKSSGAYASYTKDHPALILMNWTGDLYSVMTLGHEFGHAYHGHCSQKQPQFYFDSPLSLAETASIFTETFMFNRLLERVSIDERKNILFSYLDNYFQTVFRQVMITLFEKDCHKVIEENGDITFDEIESLWQKHTKLLYGDAVEYDPEDNGRWISSHVFNHPFYCFTYAFGNTLSLALYEQWESADDKDEFFKEYHTILESGGSQKPKELLEKSGIDISSVDFVENSLSVIRRMIAEL